MVGAVFSSPHCQGCHSLHCAAPPSDGKQLAKIWAKLRNLDPELHISPLFWFTRLCANRTSSPRQTFLARVSRSRRRILTLLPLCRDSCYTSRRAGPRCPRLSLAPGPGASWLTEMFHTLGVSSIANSDPFFSTSRPHCNLNTEANHHAVLWYKGLDVHSYHLPCTRPISWLPKGSCVLQSLARAPAQIARFKKTETLNHFDKWVCSIDEYGGLCGDHAIFPKAESPVSFDSWNISDH